MSYKIIVKRKGKEDIIQGGYDELNVIIISAELKMRFEKQIKSGLMSVEVEEE